MSSTSSITSAKDIMQRVEALDWNHISQDLDSHGNAIIKNLISSNECDALVDLYCEDNIFRSGVVMEHGFGLGEYKYFNYPLPDIIASLRTNIYPHLVPIANQWNKMILWMLSTQKNMQILSRGAMMLVSSSRHH